MDLKLKEEFLELWGKHFGIAELPIVFYYYKEFHNATRVAHGKGRSCIICELAKVSNPMSFTVKSAQVYKSYRSER